LVVFIKFLLLQDLWIEPGVANPNWSLGRNLENLPKIWTFGPQYDKKLEKSLIIDSSLGRGLATPGLNSKIQKIAKNLKIGYFSNYFSWTFSCIFCY
jgi:hypothetical protein